MNNMPNPFGYSYIATCIVIFEIMFIPIGMCIISVVSYTIYSKTLREKTFAVGEESYAQKNFYGSMLVDLYC